ncbi:MAG TPA: YDG domain-containing protein [Nocardioidaceae bacterium]|nr:YDG domain-containing protein [Nocardioidaceae bacterium]
MSASALVLGVAGVAQAADEGTSTPTGAPTIASDQADYPPGATVVLSGGGWQPGEAVHVYVNDDDNRTWERHSDVVADETGMITDTFSLPNWFVANYRVTATGSVSGEVVTTFTDANVSLTISPGGVPVTITVKKFNANEVCPTDPKANTSTVTVTGGPTNVGGGGSLATFTAPQNVTANGVQYSFARWTNGSTQYSTLETPCVSAAPASDTSLVAVYEPSAKATSTALASNNNASTYGQSVTFTATVTSTPSNPSSSGTVTFKDGATTLCNAVALTGNTATCSTATLTAATHPITATYNPGTGFLTSTSNTVNQVVNKKSITGSFTAHNKAYDGNTSATIASRSLSGVVGTDAVNLVGGTATFDTDSVGTGKTVTGSGFSISGAAADNYTLASSTLTTTANITELSLSVDFTASNKVYDGNRSATILTRTITAGLLANDDVAVTGGEAAFDSSNAGTTKTITAEGFTLTGADAGNYSIGSIDTATADITPKPITGSFTANNKPYDGNTSATVLTRTLTGVVGNDAVSLDGGAAAFDTKAVGTGKTVTLTGATLSGAAAGNYTLTEVGTTTADITAAGVTVSFTAGNKVYNGNAVATITGRSVSGVLGSDVVTVSGGSASFDDKNVGAGKAVTASASGFTLGGADGGNYTIIAVNPTTADITALHITGSFTADDKVYDGNDSAEVLTRTLIGALGGDAVFLTDGTAKFDDENVGNNKTVTLTGASLTGGDAGNYALDSVNTAKANITALPIVGTFTADNKEYDGNTNATVLTRSLVGAIYGDDVELVDGTASFEDKNVGNDKTVTLRGAELDGDDAGNYSLSLVFTAKANITPKSITGTFTADNKEYDGNTNATVVTRDLVGAIDGDDVELVDGTASFEDKNVGNDKTVTLTGAELDGDDAGNYTLASVATTTANITAKSITGTFTADNKEYDGNTSATVLSRGLAGVINDDVVSLSGGTATFADKNVGTAKVVTLTGGSLTGADASNYTLSSVATTTANITPLHIAGTFTAKDKVYTGTTAAEVLTRGLVGQVSDDDVVLSGGTAAFANKNVGTAKTVTLTGATLAGNDAGNYVLDSVATTTASITPAPVSGSFTAYDKVVDGTRSATVKNTSLTGVIAPDVVNLVVTNPLFDTASVGTGKTVTASLSLSGADSGNYALTSTTATTTASITYAWGGFLQPINDTAHQVGVAQSKFKLGQTIPAKFVIKDAFGTVVQQSSQPQFSKVFRGKTCDASGTTEAVSTLTADAGAYYKWDGSQYHYNWSTKGLEAGEWRIFAILADGTSQYTDICLTK